MAAETVGMDVDIVSKSPIDQFMASVAAGPKASDQGFGVTMAAQGDDGASVVEEAERLVGTRIRAPEGGCGCDAFVSSVAPSTPSPRPSDANPAALPSFSALQTFAAQERSSDARPGDVLTLGDPADLSGHLHRAILRNATEMITAHRSGLVEVLSIPWEQVQPR